MNNNFFKILLLFFSTFYFYPFILHLFFKEEFSLIYRESNLFESQLFTIIIVMVFFIFYKFKNNYRIINIHLPGLIWNRNILYILTFLFFILSAYFYVKYDYQFRHKGEHLSETGGIIIFLTALRSFFKAYLFLNFLYFLRKGKSLGSPFIYLLIAISFWLSKVSSMDIPLIILPILFSIKKGNLLTQKIKVKIKIFNNIFTRIALALVIVILIVFMGVANKIGFERAQQSFSDTTFLSSIVFSTSLRFSTYYASVFGAYSASEQDSDSTNEAIYGTFINTVNRGEYLITGNLVKEKPEFWSVYRANFMNLFLDNSNPRTGASPGIVASAFYFPSTVLGFFIIFLYIWFVVSNLKVILNYNTSKLNLVGILFGFIFVIPFFESPFDYINIFNPSFIYLYFCFVNFKSIHDA
ncbi:hypothetical protein FNJ87_18355 [Nonlabens mediterrranea]|uniref:Oligosaccharide repeat unit polymerase n=1 Tax=Nonlabens mediterrranea TaxID=1419947 RepID=A0ABS0A9X2_9FLAO|nr:hypothetical protein [Nonlabens mediterrranea]